MKGFNKQKPAGMMKGSSPAVDRLAGGIRGLWNLTGATLLSAALTATAYTTVLTSCGERDDPLPPPPPEHQPTTHNITINSMADFNMPDIRSKASANNMADSVILNMSNIGVLNTDFIRIIEYVNMAGGEFKNIHINWLNGSLYPGGNGIVLSLENWDRMGRPPLSLSPSGARFNNASGEKPSDFGLYGNVFSLSGPGDIVITNTAEFADKCKSAAGKRIEIQGSISLDIENAIHLKNAITAGASFFVAAGGNLEFTVDADKNLERLGIDVIAAACMGQSVIDIMVKTNPATGLPYITVFNQGILDAAYTAATVGTAGSGIPGKASYGIRFIGEDGKLINPVISGKGYYSVFPDSLFAEITNLEARHGRYTWDIAEKSAGRAGLLSLPPLVRSPTGTIDFYYPIPSLAGIHAQIIDRPPSWWPAYSGKLTLVSVGEFVNKTVIAGSMEGIVAPSVFWFVLGFGEPERIFSINIHNTDLIVWCYDDMTYLSYGLSGPSIINRGEYALSRIKEVNPGMQFFDSDGQLSTKLRVAFGYAVEPYLQPGQVITLQQYPREYVLYLIEGIIR